MITPKFILPILFFLSLHMLAPPAFAAEINCKGIGSYKDLKKNGMCNGEVHHLIEKRFAPILGLNPDSIPSICLSKEEHRVFTNLWRDQIPYAGDYSNVSATKIIKVICVIYKDNPCVLQHLTKYLGKVLKGKYKHIAKKLFKKSPKYLKLLNKVAFPLMAIGSGFEVYKVFAVLDDNLTNDKFVAEALKYSIEAMELYDEKDETPALKKLGDAYFFLGYAHYHKMVEWKTTFAKEPWDLVVNKSDEYLKNGITLFEKSIVLEKENAMAHFCLGDMFLQTGNIASATIHFTIAQKLFKEDGRDDWVSQTTDKLIKIEEVK